MIVVDLDLWPHGNERTKHSLGKIHIINDGTGTVARGNYIFRLYGKNGKMAHEGTVKNFPRKSYTVFNLLKRCLATIEPR